MLLNIVFVAIRQQNGNKKGVHFWAPYILPDIIRAHIYLINTERNAVRYHCHFGVLPGVVYFPSKEYVPPQPPANLPICAKYPRPNINAFRLVPGKKQLVPAFADFFHSLHVQAVDNAPVGPRMRPVN